MRIRSLFFALTIGAAACSNGNGGDAVVSAEDGATTTSTLGEMPAPPVPVVENAAVSLCEDIAAPVPTVIGTLPGGQNLDNALTEIVVTYAAENLDTYAGRWIDRDYGGTLVVAFTDDSDKHLAELLTRIPPEFSAMIEVVQVAHSEAELATVNDEIGALFEVESFNFLFVGGGQMINRVSIALIRPTQEDLERLAQLLPVDMVCVYGPLWDESQAPPSVDEPLTIMVDSDDDPIVSCGFSSGSSSFRLSVLDQPPDVMPGTSDPAEIVLLAGGIGGVAVPQQGWRTLSRTDDEVLFVNFEHPSGDLYSHVENTPIGWSLASTNYGRDCRGSLRLVPPDGVSIMRLGLNPEFPVDPDSTTLHILVSEEACSGGSDPSARIRPPEVIETVAEVRIAVAVVPPLGAQACPSNPSVALSIDLEAPIGNRTIVDGTRVPSEPLGDIGPRG